ncbi:MAG TPA: GNAT family N-acetyltransferase [Candidatus Limnocylindrales bacterium]|nr:GNAT family N-acetyltransferase [Candidatus Limnocylindrales bacterium]
MAGIDASPGTADPAAPSITYRPATDADLPTCAAIWRSSINDYTSRLNQPDIPDDLAAILRLYGHLRSTDPDLFVVAEARRPGEEARTIGFAAAVRRPPLWFLSMLFIEPDAQGAGVGRELLRRVMPTDPDGATATCTDSVQPISNALYASLGIVPRLPLLRLVGLPDRLDELPGLPAGIRPVRFEPDDDPDAMIAPVVAASSQFDAGADHAFIRAEGRIGFRYAGPDGRTLGYGYASEAGRVGPAAAVEPDLLAPIVAHLVTEVEPRGAFGIWVPGAAGATMVGLLRSGFRIDGFPCLVCWNRPVVDFSRYVPISPGLL